MPAQQLMVGLIGMEKQVAKGTPGTTPALYGFGAASGKVANVEITQEPDPITIAGTAAIGRVQPAATRTDAMASWGFTTLAYPRTTGMLLYGVAGATAFASTTNTITPALSLPYFTFYGKMGNTPLYTLTSDCQVSDVTISWDQRNALQVAAEIRGLALNPSTSAWTATNNEAGQTYYTPPNALASYQLDVSSATPAAAQVTAANLHFSNDLKPVQLSKSVIPDDFVPGIHSLEGSITIIPNDFTDWIKAVTGTGAGTTISNVTVYGSFSLLIAIDASTSLTIAATDKVAYTADLSDVDPSGGPMPLELNFRALGATAPYTIASKSTAADYSA